MSACDCFPIVVNGASIHPDECATKWGDCIGNCGRRTNGWFADGDLGPGWYCGWCGPVPGCEPHGKVV